LVSFLLIAVLTIIIIVLAVVFIQRELQISSLKKQVDFLEESLQQFIEKEKKIQILSKENSTFVDFPPNSPRSLH
jgi:hypothetical protein